MKTVAVAFTNFGPYHLARLRALAGVLNRDGGRLIAYEMAAAEATYPWTVARDDEPFEWVTLCPDRVLETIPAADCRARMTEALDRDRPDGLGVVGYSRPESLAMLSWGGSHGVPTALMSETQAIDHPRVWWKEVVKRRRVSRFSAALVGGPRHHDYLVSLGLPADRIAFGYNAVDGDGLAAEAAAFRQNPEGRDGVPDRPYFLAVSRFVPEKNLEALILAYTRYREVRPSVDSWDLVLCGSGPSQESIGEAKYESNFASSIHLPGFVQAGSLAKWYAHASAFVHPSVMEPWGLVVNEAAACGLPLLVSDRAGAVETFVPEEPGTEPTGRRIDGRDVDSMAAALSWMASLTEAERRTLGETARNIARQWGPERFAEGTMEAFRLAQLSPQLRTRVRWARPAVVIALGSNGDTPMKSTTAHKITNAPPRHFREGWVHLCNGLDPVRDGGMVPSILGMTGALATLRGEPVTIVTPTPSRLGETRIPEGLTLRGPETDVDAVIRGAGLIHMHGLWQGHTRRGAATARSAKVPYLMAAHGMAEPWALKHKKWKKRIYTALVERKNLQRAACLHALSRPEIGHLRAIAPDAKVCFVPNGVDLAPFDDLPPRSALEADYPEIAGKFVLLFYGRVHVKKGLDLLAGALKDVAKDHPDVHAVIAGNDDGALQPFRDRCEALGVIKRITWVGHVSGERARKVWSAADAFVLPSYSEGFSMAVLEALACRLPTLITTSCHFPELAAADGGIVVEPDLDGVTRGLRELLERSTAERDAMAARGRALVERQYTWDRQASRLADVYRWIEGGGAEPEALV